LRTIDNQGEPNDDLGVPDDDIKDPDAFRSLEDLVNALMFPPKNHVNPKDAQGNVMHDRVQVRLNWVKQTVSEKHFIFDPVKGRSVLRNDSKIRTHGRLYGLPKRYFDFLCANELEPSSFKSSRDLVWMTKEEFVKVCVLSNDIVKLFLTNRGRLSDLVLSDGVAHRTGARRRVGRASQIFILSFGPYASLSTYSPCFNSLLFLHKNYVLPFNTIQNTFTIECRTQ
jgi:hypothetical protein